MGGRGDQLDPLLLDHVGHQSLLLGNEAIVRGALEAGVGFAAGYPGTPSSEITDTFARLSPLIDLPFEYSVNEKIALEMAFAASLAGARAIVAMKHLGLSSAGDPLSTIPYIGTVGGLVIVSAGDPSCATSPNEQDQRQLADMLHLIALDPSTPQEALEMTRFAFQLSEQSRLPVLLRPTARLCHGRAAVRFGPLQPRRPAALVREPRRFIPTPNNARRLRREIDERLDVAKTAIAGSGFVRAEGQGRVGLVTCGVSAAIARDVLATLDAPELVRIELGAVYPLPEDWLADRLAPLEHVLVIEELSPFVEDAVRALAQLRALPVQIHGKRTGHLPEAFEYTPRLVERAIRGVLDLAAGRERPLPDLGENDAPASTVPARPPILCAGCPHRASFFAAKSAFGDDTLFFNDIGCYTLGVDPPLGAGDALLCMGAGFTLAAGAARVTKRRTVGFMGDATFFHSGMPAMLNAIKENADVTLVILDNSVTAMTGFQDSPGVSTHAGRIERSVDIEAVVRALGAPHVEKIDPADLPRSIAAFQHARDARGTSVVIAEHPCPVFEARAVETQAPRPPAYSVDPTRCQTCGRAALGHRCGQAAEACFERAMSTARSLEIDRAASQPVAPCATRCPLFLCVQGYAAQIAAGKYERALELIMRSLPLPDSVCRVCHRPCEDACVRAASDGAVAINDLKRFVVDWAARQVDLPYRPELEADHGRRVAIVGAGPSGLAAAHDLRLRGYRVDLFDEADAPGGVLLRGIPGYRLPAEALQRDLARIFGLGGISFTGHTRVGREIEVDQLLDRYSAVYLAVGAQRSPSLGFSRAIPALEYLADRDRDERGRSVVVVGGGNSAIDSARSALRRGAERVHVVCLESRDEMPAIRDEVLEAEREGVTIHERCRVIAVADSTVDLVRVAAHVMPWKSVDDFSPVAGSEETLAAGVLISAIGQRPDRSGLGDLEVLWKGDLLAIDPHTGSTSQPGLFAGGDLTSSEQTVTGAIAAGLRAAWGIDRRLRGSPIADRRPPPPRIGEVPTGSRSARRATRAERARPRALAPEEARRTFAEAASTLDEVTARAEAERCMICGQCGNCRSCIDLFGCPAFHFTNGRIAIDARLCTGCGVCATFCPNGAIEPLSGGAA